MQTTAKHSCKFPLILSIIKRLFLCAIAHISPPSLSLFGHLNYNIVKLHDTFNLTLVPRSYPRLFPRLLPCPSLAIDALAGRPCGRPHHQLPAGEVPRGSPEPRGEKLPHLLSADGGRRGGPAETPGPGEEPTAVPVSGQSECVTPRYMTLPP